MSKPFYDFSKIISAAAPVAEDLCRELYPQGKKEGSNYCIGDASGATGRSFKISLKPANGGCYIDMADKDVRGNVIALVALAKNMSYVDSAHWLANRLNIPPEENIQMTARQQKPEFMDTSALGMTPKAIAYGESRGISADNLINCKCLATANAIIFQHFDINGDLGMQKFWAIDGTKQIWSNKNPIHTLFDKERIDPVVSGGQLIITEGQWDSLSWHEAGLPAVSVPTGVNNEQWITEDWAFLNQFSTIYLDFDKDPQGLEAAKRVQSRLGYDRTKIITYNSPHKDANEILCDKGLGPDYLRQVLTDTRDAPVQNIIEPVSIKDQVKQILANQRVAEGVPFFLYSPSFAFEFRPHEITLWYGYTGHGKSTAIMQQFAFQAGQGVSGMIASFEATSPINYATLLTQYMADPNCASSDEFSDAYDDLTSKVILYDAMKRTSPQELIATMILAHKQFGICSFCVDNVMTLDVDRQDNTAQADTADLFRIFAAKYPVHIHICAHPRKPSEAFIKPPALSEVRGASEWVDMPQNVLCVYRDMAKADKISLMYDGNVPIEQIIEVRNASPDGRFLIRKQRFNGMVPNTGFMFNSKCKRFYRPNDPVLPYYQPPEMLPIEDEEDTIISSMSVEAETMPF